MGRSGEVGCGFTVVLSSRGSWRYTAGIVIAGGFLGERDSETTATSSSGTVGSSVCFGVTCLMTDLPEDLRDQGNKVCLDLCVFF